MSETPSRQIRLAKRGEYGLVGASEVLPPSLLAKVCKFVGRVIVNSSEEDDSQTLEISRTFFEQDDRADPDEILRGLGEIVAKYSGSELDPEIRIIETADDRPISLFTEVEARV